MLFRSFEQQHFIDDKKITKEFNHELDSEDIKITTEILHFSGTNPEERKKIETEQEAWRTVNAMFEDKEKELMTLISDKDKAIDEKDKALDENKKVIDEKERIIQELLKKLDDKK